MILRLVSNLTFGICLLLVSNVQAQQKGTIVEFMAAHSIVLRETLASYEEDPIKRTEQVQKLVDVCFRYWYETRYLGTERAQVVDLMIKGLYETAVLETTSLSSDLKQAFRDPLDALESGNRLKVRKNWEFSSKEEYGKLLVRFSEFLEAPRK